MSLDKIKAKLEALKQQSTQSSGEGNKEFKKITWKPSPGKQVIRILPNIPLNLLDKPFVPIDFYFQYGKMYQMSPSNFDKPDPIIEYCNEALLPKGVRVPAEEFKSAMELKKKLQPQTRIFCPVLVRGEEHLGVRFWEFGIKTYRDLSVFFDDDDYADAASLTNGIDFNIEFIPSPDPKDARHNKVIPTPKRNSSPATEDPELIKLINEMPNIMENYQEANYDDLKNSLRNFLQVPENIKSEPAKEKESVPNPRNVTVNHDETNKGFDVKVEIPSKPESTVDYEKEFDDLLNSK